MTVLAIAKQEAAKGHIEYPQEDVAREAHEGIPIGISLTPPFSVIQHIVESAGPLRRPNRNGPIHTSSSDDEQAIWDEIERIAPSDKALIAYAQSMRKPPK
jgi:hypothetical protein